MNKKLTLLNKILLLFGLVLAGAESQGQFFWLGFQAGEGISWFTNPGVDSISLSEGNGTSLGFFIRYGKRPYYQVAFEWLTTNNQVRINVEPGVTKKSNFPVHSFKVPITAGYEVVHRPKFKWRIGGGFFIGPTVPLSSNAFNFNKSDFKNPQFGVIGETGIQYFNFLILVDYNYSLTKLFNKNAGDYGMNLDSHMQIFALKAGLQF